MMNSIASSVVGLALGAGGLALTGTVRTADVVPGARMPRLEVWFRGLEGSAASFALVFGVIATWLVTQSYRRTRFGRELGLVGDNPVAMAAEKVDVRGRLEQALVVSGALVGAGVRREQ